MAHLGGAGRNLSLTEELEKLEQSITLTLQEIDHNFSRAHRIVTMSILPLVEQYGEHSRAVWEASKFWKQFFEASANVSLSGYEELTNDDAATDVDVDQTVTDDGGEDSTAEYISLLDEADDTTKRPDEDQSTLHREESLLDDTDLTGSTPRPPASKRIQPQLLSNLESPYEAMRREMKEEELGTASLGDEDFGGEEEDDSTLLFAQRTARLPDMSMTPKSWLGRGSAKQSTQQHKDPLLHRVLDKNYRLQATPHRPPYHISPLKKAGEDESKEKQAAWHDSPASSPEMAVPTLRSEAFLSPYKNDGRQRLAAATRSGPRTPGLSVQTPSTAKKSRNALASAGESVVTGRQGRQQYEIDWDSDEEGDDVDLYAGMSPPKTIQFALPPSKLLQTPAREASKRIVENILLDAGADPASSEYSPSMVKMNENIANDSF